MGLFDSLAKLGKNIVENELAKKVNEVLPDELKGSSNSYNSNYKIPSKYSGFPVFNGNISSLNENKSDRYERCTIDYSNTNNEEVNNYIRAIEDSGYVKASKVRYEKDNTYIIVEDNNGHLHLVFHIKN